MCCQRLTVARASSYTVQVLKHFHTPRSYTTARYFHYISPVNFFFFFLPSFFSFFSFFFFPSPPSRNKTFRKYYGFSAREENKRSARFSPSRVYFLTSRHARLLLALRVKRNKTSLRAIRPNYASLTLEGKRWNNSPLTDDALSSRPCSGIYSFSPLSFSFLLPL